MTGERPAKTGQMEKYTGPPINTGSWGPLPWRAYARWVEQHDPRNLKVDYMGRSEKQPGGMYKVYQTNAPEACEYLTPAQVKWVALNALGMTRADEINLGVRVDAAQPEAAQEAAPAAKKARRKK